MEPTTARLITLPSPIDTETASSERQPLEPDLIRAQRDIDRAEHLVFVDLT